MKNQAISSGVGMDGRQSVQATRDAPPWDQMRARIGGKMEGLAQVVGTLHQALSPVLEQTGKNTPQPRGVEVAQPHHDSGVMEFMRNLERQIDEMRERLEFMTRGLPFDSTPF